MTYDLRLATSDEDWRNYHEIRRTALFDNLGRHGVYIEEHPDEYAPGHHPLLLFHNGAPVATVRVDELGGAGGALRLVAVRVEEQGKGHGRTLSRLAERYAWSLQIRTLYVNAAPEAVGYYLKMGWERFIWDISELQEVAGNCVQMKKALSQ
jgi:GNAT superfamily N-acetyltransferase